MLKFDINRPIWVFSDLDSTLFSKNQTNQKKIGAYSYDKSNNLQPSSFLNDKQLELSNLLLENKNINFIPITARNEEQYKRTFLYYEEKLPTFIYGFTKLVINNKEEIKFNNYINEKIRKFDDFLNLFFRKIKDFNQNINIRRNTNFIQIILQDKEDFILIESIKKIFNILQSKDSSYINNIELKVCGKNIYIKPIILNKVEPLNYLIEKYKPTLTIGIGDSLLDYEFMNRTDFQIIPKDSDYNKKINKLLKI